jgi:AmpD protein
MPEKTWAPSGSDHVAAVPFAVDSASQCLSSAAWLPSPNFDARPDDSAVSLLVIHNIALPPEGFADAGRSRRGSRYIDDLFLNQLETDAHPYFAALVGLRVSAHLCIFRDGSIHQYVRFDQRAWHAGVSQWRGRPRCNDYAIGIELEGSDTQPFADAQYGALIATTRALFAAYPGLSPTTIVGHSDIAPGRKTDPGPYFDWPRYLGAL